jgi:glutamyl-tRNA synthetase
MPDEREEFTLEEFIEEFRLEDISLGGPVFDLDKLTWLNGRYIREHEPEQLLERLREDALSDANLLQVLPLVRERIDSLDAFFDYGQFFFVGDLAYDEDARTRLVAKGRTAAQTAKAFRLLVEEDLDPLLDWRPSTIEDALRGFCERHDWTPKELFMPVRIAVTGRSATPPLFDTMAVVGREMCRRRLRCAIDVLRGMK